MKDTLIRCELAHLLYIHGLAFSFSQPLRSKASILDLRGDGGASQVLIEECCFVGGTDPQVADHYLIALNMIRAVRFRHCRFDGGTWGIGNTGSDDVVLEACTFVEQARASVIRPQAGWSLANCSFDWGPGYALFSDSVQAQSLSVLGCSFATGSVVDVDVAHFGGCLFRKPINSMTSGLVINAGGEISLAGCTFDDGVPFSADNAIVSGVLLGNDFSSHPNITHGPGWVVLGNAGHANDDSSLVKFP